MGKTLITTISKGRLSKQEILGILERVEVEPYAPALGVELKGSKLRALKDFIAD